MLKKKQNQLYVLIFALIYIFSQWQSFTQEKPQSLTQEKLEVFPQLGHTREVTSVAFSPDGKYALSGSNDTTLKLWEIKTCR
jgi:WD40 repeat protein